MVERDYVILKAFALLFICFYGTFIVERILFISIFATFFEFSDRKYMISKYIARGEGREFYKKLD